MLAGEKDGIVVWCCAGGVAIHPDCRALSFQVIETIIVAVGAALVQLRGVH